MLMLNELLKKQLIITIFDDYVCIHVRYNFKLLTDLVLAYWLLNRHVNQSIVDNPTLQTTPVSLQLVLGSYFETVIPRSSSIYLMLIVMYHSLLLINFT